MARKSHSLTLIFSLLATLLLAPLMLIMMMADEAEAQSSLPMFGCTGDIYQVQSGQLRIFDPITSSYTNVGPQQSSYNATGYNILDNYAYASQGGNIIRIGADGNIETVFNIGFGSYSGDVDYSNNYYLRRNNNRYDRIDLATGTITPVNFTGGGGGPADVAFIPGNNSLTGFGGGNMFRYNLNTNTKDVFSVSGLPGGGYGATWTDFGGRLFTFNNSSGLLYEIFDYETNAPTATLVATGVPSGNNDGFSCSQSNFPNLPPDAEDDDFTTPVNVPVTGNVIADNGNGPDFEPDGGMLTASGPDTGPSNGAVTLNPDGSFTYTPDVYFIGTDTFTYTVTDPGGLTDTATVTIVVTGDIGMEVNKRRISGPAVATAEGQVIGYEITVVNTGDIPLTGISLVDTLPDGTVGAPSGPVEGGGTDGRDQPGRVDVGETWTYTINYTVQQSDIDGGGPLVNTASVTSTETGPTPEEDTATVPVAQRDGYTFTKTADVASFTNVGDPIVFTLSVENIGNVTLTDVVVTDPFFDPDLSCDIASIAPGVTDTSCSFTYNVTQADIDRGEIVNTATVNGNGANGDPLDPETSTATVDGPAANPVLRVEKTDEGDDGLFGAVGDTETFTFEVFNDGNVTLSGLTLNDPDLGFSCTLPDIAPGTSVTACADATPLSADLPITQPIFDAGSYENTVSVNGVDPNGTPVSDDDTVTLAGPDQLPALGLVKSVTSGDPYAAVDDVISYAFEVTNTGNVTITEPITIADSITTAFCPVLPAGGLPPGDSITCTADYDVTQIDLDNGAVNNTATANVTQPVVPNATYPGGTANVSSGPSSAVATATELPAIEIAKALNPSSPVSFSATSDVLTFDFTVTNTGNVTLFDAITVNDPQIGATVTCFAGGGAGVAPGDSVTCSATWSPSQPDIDAGSFTNSATADTTYNSDPVTTPDPAEVTVPAQQDPELSLTKVADPIAPADFVPGATVTYTYTVTNTGNTTITNQITITDDRIPPGDITCNPFPMAGIPPTGTYECVGTYTVTPDDVNITSVVNNATASDGTTTSEPATETVPSGATPALDVDKVLTQVANPDTSVQPGLQFDEVGDVLTYSFTVENTGTQAFVNPITVVDDLVPGSPITCWAPSAGDTAFAAGDTATCFGTYTVTQADLDAGEVINSAFASTTFGTIPTTYNSPTDTETATGVEDPGLTVTKDVTTGPDPAAVDDVLTYTLTALNSGNQTLSNVVLSDPLIPTLSCSVGGTPVSGPTVLEPGEALICTGNYTVTQDDIDAQILTNTATATGVDPNGDGVDDSGSDTHPLDPAAPAVTITKDLTAGTPTPAYTQDGDTISYTITVLNSGNVTLDSVEVTDTLDPTICTVGPLDPGESDTTCVFTYTVDQGDIDAGEVENTVNATATPIPSSGAGPVTDEDTLITPGPERTPSIELEKLADVTSVAMENDPITYTFRITNTGNITLTALPVIVDPLLTTAPTCDPLPPGGLLPGATTECSATYAAQQSEIDNGAVVNTAMAEIENPLDPGGPPLSDDDTLSIPAVQMPDISLTKTADLASFNAPNQTITYTFTVTNTGNVTLTDPPTITDPLITTGITCDPLPPGGLEPTDTLDCTGTYLTTQDDVDAGEVMNSATASVPDPTDPGNPLTAGDDATVPADQTVGIDVTKTPSVLGGVEEGDTITYTYTVQNTGNTTLTNVVLDDQHSSASGTNALAISGGGVVLSLAPGQIETFTATYTVTQADIDAGAPLTNVVSATGTSPDGLPDPSDSENASVDVTGPAPALVVLKEIQSLPADLVAGEDIVFRVLVENTGNVTLTGVTLTDELRRADGTLILPTPTPVGPASDTGTAGALDVDEVWTYTVTYTLTQADVDAGGIANSVLAEAEDPFGTPVDDLSDEDSPAGDDPTLVQIPADPSIEAVKTITTPATTVGGTVVFEIAVENTGNVTLTSVGILSDTVTRLDGTPATGTLSAASFTGSDAGSPNGTLVPGETATYSISYTLTQEDIDAGGIENTATATGNPPTGGPITDVSDDDGVFGTDDPTVQEIPPAPSITMDKRLDAGGPSFDATTDVLTFAFDITNTGNITLDGPFTINDAFLAAAGVTPVCPAGPLAPNATLTCTADYTVTQADIDAGQIENTATASTDVDGTTVESASDTETVPAVQSPELTLDKVADPLGPADFVVGATVTYTYTVTNTGNTTITNPITITDDRIPPGDITCDPFPPAGIPPTGTYECVGTYTVTSDDVDITSVVNNATASDGTTTSDPASETVPNNATPALSIDKVLTQVVNPDTSVQPGLQFDEVGDVLSYSFTVENTGTQAFVNPITVVDDLVPGSPISCWAPSGGDPDFTAGETATCFGTYTVTQADLDAGEVVNSAFASTSFGSIPTTYNSPADTETATAAGAPALDLVKTVSGTPVTAVDQTLTYTLTATNTGNQTVSNVVITDPLVPMLTCTVGGTPQTGPAILAPGEALICTGTYDVTQDDIDADPNLTNTGSVSGVSPDGTGVEDDDSETVAMPVANPSLNLTKTANPTPFGPVGTDVIYTFRVENTGNVTMTNIVVTDPIDPGYSCAVPDLAPGEINSTCTLSYMVTQDDIDAAEITNIATVIGDGARGGSTSDSDILTTPGPTPDPALELTKTAGAGPLILGGVIPFTFTVENTGTVTLNPPVLSDTMTRIGDNSPTALDAPPAFQSGDTDNDGLLGVGEIWVYTANFTITQADIDQGGIQNTATANATDGLGNPAGDTSDDGDDGDGNTTDDPTVVPIVPAPGITVTKEITQTGSMPNDVIIFTITGLNTGNVTLDNPVITDTLTQLDGTPVAGTVNAPVLTSGNAGGIAPGEAWVWEVTYILQQGDIDAGGLSNTATAGGTTPGGDDVEDVSDDGDPTDGNTTDDPTELLIDRMPNLEVIKTVASAGGAVGETIVFEVAATNIGNVTLTGLTITDEDLTDFNGSALTPTSVTITSGDPTGVLQVGETTIFTVVHTITQSDIDAGGVRNSATVQGTSPTGQPVSDISDTGGGDGSTPTEVPIAQIDLLEVTKEAGTPTRISPTVVEVSFTISVANTGNTTQTGILIEDDLAAVVAPSVLLSVEQPVPSGFASGAGNPSYDGVSDILVMNAPPDLAPGESGSVELVFRLDVSAGVPASENTVSVTSDRISEAVTGSAEFDASIGDEDLFVTKTVTPDTAILGDTVTYTMTFQNRLTSVEANLTLVDQLPEGIVYTPGTARFNGSAVPAPDVVGRQLRWPGVTIGGGETITVTIQARIVGGASGELTNTAYVLGPDGRRVSNVASATVRRRVEALFDCAEIIGRVFDDRNFNGVFDDGTEPNHGQPREVGLPRVRLSTVDGTLITTDEHGRFSVPCAALPRPGTGSNFQLEVDARTLPSGFFMTTENPRILRVTPGSLTVMNFGATLGQLIEIDLTASAFDADGTPTHALEHALANLVQHIRTTPTVLRLSYYRTGESHQVADARLDLLENRLQDLWGDLGRYQLTVETQVFRAQ